VEAERYNPQSQINEVKPSIEWMAEAAGVFQDIKLLASVLDFMHPLFVRMFSLNSMFRMRFPRNRSKRLSQGL